LVSTSDIELAVLEDVLVGNGIVKGFPFVAGGDFATDQVGWTTLVVETRDGNPLPSDGKALINKTLLQLVGNQYVSVIDPQYVSFDVTATIALKDHTVGSAVVAAINGALTAVYAPSEGTFGMAILRERIIEVIQDVAGVARIVSGLTGPILASPPADVVLRPWEQPRLGTVTITVG
jgi:hypothetical protein